MTKNGFFPKHCSVECTFAYYEQCSENHITLKISRKIVKLTRLIVPVKRLTVLKSTSSSREFHAFTIHSVKNNV